MRDRNNSTEVGGDNSGPIIQAEKYYQDSGQWPVVAIAVAAICALALLAMIALRDDDVAGNAIGAPGGIPGTTASTDTATSSHATPSTNATPSSDTAPTTTTPARTTEPAKPTRQLHSERRSIRRTNVDVDPPQPAPNGAGAVYTLDYLPAPGGGPPATADLYAGGNPFAAPNRIAQWTDGGVPDGEQCADHLRRMGTNKVSLAVGGVYCVASPLGRIVVLSEITFTDDDAFGLVTVWGE